MTALRLIALVVGVAVGFVGARARRRSAGGGSAGSMARTVGGALGRRRGLTPPELQRATFSEMMRHVRVGRHGGAEVPSQFQVRLHPADAATVDQAPRWFVDGLADALQQAADDNGWTVNGRIAITVEPDPTRPEGAPAVRAGRRPPPAADAVVPSGPPPPGRSRRPDPVPRREGPGPPPAPDRAVLQRLDTDDRVPVERTGLTIGRGTDQSLVVDDPRVSRRHAEVSRAGDGWVVVDRGSSNGTRLNGVALVSGRPTPLAAGDIIAVGPFDLRFDLERAAPPGPPSEERTTDLDDETRTRLSRDYLTTGDPAPDAPDAPDGGGV